MGNFLTTGKAFRQNAFDSYDIVQNERWPQNCFHPPTGSLAMSTRQCANINFSINFSISFLLCLIGPNQCLGGVNSVECINPMTKHSCRFSRTFGALSTSKWHLDDTQGICACFKLKKSFRNLSQLFALNLSFSLNYTFYFIFFRQAPRICLYFQHLRSQYTNCPQVSNFKYSNTIQRDPCDEQLLKGKNFLGRIVLRVWLWEQISRNSPASALELFFGLPPSELASFKSDFDQFRHIWMRSCVQKYMWILYKTCERHLVHGAVGAKRCGELHHGLRWH